MTSRSRWALAIGVLAAAIGTGVLLWYLLPAVVGQSIDWVFAPSGELSLSGVAWTTLVSAASSVVTSVATALYLFATWALLMQTGKAHKENQTLTRRLHADTLTPVLYLAAIDQNLYVSSRSNPDLRVSDATPNPDGTLRVNSLTDIPLDHLELVGDIALDIGNASSNVADTTVAMSGACGDLLRRTVIAPNESSRIVFDVNRKVSESGADIQSILEGRAQVHLLVTGNGPGMSAQDGFDAAFPVAMETCERRSSRCGSESWPAITRYREYDLNAWR